MAKAWKVTGIEPHLPVDRVARRVLAVRIAELFSYAPYIRDPARVDELHALRIAAKRLRYSLEIFEPYLASPAAHLIEQVKQIQEHLGEIHDADVLVPYLKERLTIIQGVERDTLIERLRLCQDESARRSLLHGYLARPADARLLGLWALLGRTLERRQRLYSAFVQHWERLDAQGLRRQLDGLVWSNGQQAGDIAEQG